MPPTVSNERLADLLIDPREDLDFEIKSWLDIRNDNDAKATLAKAMLALANHGGGFVALGLQEHQGRVIEAPGRPATFDTYNQDLINGIVQNYADPAYHCAVHLVPDRAGSLFPIVVVPGGHRVPVRARRSGPHGNIVEQNTIYIRKPGPRSEAPQNSQEWDGLLARCLSNRRDEMFDQIRDLIVGAVPQAAPQAAPARLDQWSESSLARWRSLVAPLPPTAGPRCPHGYYWFSYEIDGERRSMRSAELPELLRASVVRHTGWPPFWYPTRSGIEPYPIDGLVECWLGRDPETPLEDQDAAHSDFWRISPEGLAFLLRGYQEDGMEMQTGGRPAIEPGTVFDITLPVWRAGEAMLHAARLAQNLIVGPANITFVAHFQGLAGRALTSVSRTRYVHENRIARQDSITLRTRVAAASIDTNLPEVIRPLLEPLYGLFDFFELPMELVTTELGRMRAGQF